MAGLPDDVVYKLVRGNAIRMLELDLEPDVTTTALRPVVTKRGMDLRYSESDEAFRAELREWLARDAAGAAAATRAATTGTARRRFDTDWQRRLFDAGYAGLSLAAEYGGRDASPIGAAVFLEETTRGAGAVRRRELRRHCCTPGPRSSPRAPTSRRPRHLPPILRGDEVWCQGFSEPGAGSDLAALRTRAVRDGDHYVVNGQKIWCSFGHVADFGELLVRTDPDAPKHRGITWLILPMDLPGHRGAADRDGARLVRVLRGVPRRRAGAGRRTGSGPRTTAGGSRRSRSRSSGAPRSWRAGRRAPARRRPRRAASDDPAHRRELGHVLAPSSTRCGR